MVSVGAREGGDEGRERGWGDEAIMRGSEWEGERVTVGESQEGSHAPTFVKTVFDSMHRDVAGSSSKDSKYLQTCLGTTYYYRF